MKPTKERAAPHPGEIERHGVESIPDHDRNASIADFVRIAWGGSNSLATAVLGAFPIMFGLSFFQALLATTLGVFIGACVLSPMAVPGRPMGPIMPSRRAPTLAWSEELSVRF